MRLVSILESLIFASDKPLTLKSLRELTSASTKDLRQALDEIGAMYRAPSGIELVEIGGGFHFRTAPANVNWVRKLIAGRPARLTRPMLETLAIIAYRQPVTRPEIEDIRGVDCGGTLRVLLERNLIRIVGKKDEPGRPLIYGTARFFLEFFQLKSLSELPTLEEFAELTEEHLRRVEEQFGDGGGTVIEQDQEAPGPPALEPMAEPTPIEPAPDEPRIATDAAAVDGDEESAAGDATSDAAGDPTSSDAAGDPTSDAAGDPTSDLVADRSDLGANIAVNDAVNAAVDDAVDAAVDDAVDDAVDAAVNDAVDDAVDAADDDALAALDRALERVASTLRSAAVAFPASPPRSDEMAQASEPPEDDHRLSRDIQDESALQPDQPDRPEHGADDGLMPEGPG